VSERRQGTVKWFNTEKGYGFILNPEGEDVFVHYRSIQIDGFKNLHDGQTVSFLELQGEKGLQAAEVKVGAGDPAKEDNEQSDQTDGDIANDTTSELADPDALDD